jgi:hypothetical protein
LASTTLFVRSRTAPTTEGPPQQFTIDPNEVDAIRGITYAQQALAALQKHATQGPWPKTISPTVRESFATISFARLNPHLPTADAKTPIDGLVLPDSIRTVFVAPTIDNKPLTEFLDKRGEVLVSLVNARKRGAFTAAKEVVDLDPQRFKLMSARLDKALATAAAWLECRKRRTSPGAGGENKDLRVTRKYGRLRRPDQASRPT